MPSHSELEARKEALKFEDRKKALAELEARKDVLSQYAHGLKSCPCGERELGWVFPRRLFPEARLFILSFWPPLSSRVTHDDEPIVVTMYDFALLPFPGDPELVIVPVASDYEEQERQKYKLMLWTAVCEP
jgi:hypothetical protein